MLYYISSYNPFGVCPVCFADLIDGTCPVCGWSNH